MPTTTPPLPQLLDLYDDARAYSMALVAELDNKQISWRPHDHSSAIGWHLGHQAAVNHYLVRNLTAAEASFDTQLDRLFDSATPEPERATLPPLNEISQYREQIAASTHKTVSKISAGDVGAPTQLALIADGLLRATIHHEYQHAAWIKEVRDEMTQIPAPQPLTTHLVEIEGYWMVKLDLDQA